MQKIADLLSGRWTIVDKSEPTTRHPNGVTRSGEERWYTLGGGIPLISTTPDGTEAFGTAAFQWDATARKYKGLFCARFVEDGCAPFDIVWPAATEIVMNRRVPR